MARRWVRFQSATLMILIAVVAIGLSVYHHYQTAAQAKINRAAALLRQIEPQTDFNKLDTEVGLKTSDGSYQHVIFRDKVTGTTMTIGYPIVDPPFSATTDPLK